MNCWHPVLSFLEKLNALTYLSKHALQTETALVMQIKKWLHEVKCNVQKRWLIRCSQWTRQTRLGGWSNIFSIPTYLPVQRLEKFEYSFVASLVAGVAVGHGSSGEICVGSLLGISNESFLLSLTMKETKRKKKKNRSPPSGLLPAVNENVMLGTATTTIVSRGVTGEATVLRMAQWEHRKSLGIDDILGHCSGLGLQPKDLLSWEEINSHH